MLEIKKILIPTDFSDYSRYALRYAVAFARSFGAKLFLFHSCEHSVLGAGTEAYHFSVPEYMTEVEKNEKLRLEDWTAEVAREKIEVEPLFAVGTAYSTIVDAAREMDVDMIILATHGRKGVSHLVFGSTAEKVVRLSPCPVLTIKYPEHEFI